jgi:hypothetical protein
VVVDAEFNGTTKTTLRSERSCVPEKEKREGKKQKKVLTRADIVRDVGLPDMFLLVLPRCCFSEEDGSTSSTLLDQEKSAG